MNEIITYGKQLVVTELERRGYTIYAPTTENKKPFDYIVSSNLEFYVVNIFVKPRRLFMYDTGFELAIYNHLIDVQNVTKLKVFLMFVDQMESKIYGNWLSVLDENESGYPLNDRTKNGKWIRYFDLNKMKTFKELTLDENNFLIRK